MPTPTLKTFSIGQQLAITCSAETGECIASSESLVAEPQYLLRYKAADGKAVEAWWTQSALSARPGHYPPREVPSHPVIPPQAPILEADLPQIPQAPYERFC